MDLFWLDGEGPKDIPEWVYRYLVNTLNESVDNLTGLLSVQKTGFWEGKVVTFIRIYDPKISKETLQVKDFTSLDERPDLILYEGYGEKGSDSVYLEHKMSPKPQTH